MLLEVVANCFDLDSIKNLNIEVKTVKEHNVEYFYSPQDAKALDVFEALRRKKSTEDSPSVLSGSDR